MTTADQWIEDMAARLEAAGSAYSFILRCGSGHQRRAAAADTAGLAGTACGRGVYRSICAPCAALLAVVAISNVEVAS